MRMDARCATKVVARTTTPRRARAALHLRSCAAERDVARWIVVARSSAHLRGRTYRAPRFGEHDADAAFYRNSDGTAAATRSAKLGVRERQHERPVLRCSLRQLAPFPAPRCASPSPGRLSRRSALSLGLPREPGHWLRLASRVRSRTVALRKCAGERAQRRLRVALPRLRLRRRCPAKPQSQLRGT